MNAYEYGMDNFRFKYQPIPNVIVFNDKHIFSDDYETDESEQITPLSSIQGEFIYAEVFQTADNIYALYEPIRSESVLYVEDYLLPNNYLTDLGNNNFVIGAEGTYQIYGLDSKFYIKYENPNSLDEVLITGSSSPKVPSLKQFLNTENKLSELLENKDLKLFFFFSTDGNKLNKAYNAIEETLSNEVIFFIENDGFRGSTSIVRVYTGSNISFETVLPTNAIAHLAERFGVVANVSEIESRIKSVFKNHLEFVKEQKEGSVFQWLTDIIDVPITVNNAILYGVGYVVKELGDAISTEFVFDDKRWNYYNENGDRAKDFSPVLQGFDVLLDHLDAKEKENTKKEDTFEVFIKAIEAKVNKFFSVSSEDNSFSKLFKKHFGFIKTLLGKLRELYVVFKETFTSKNTFIFGNALLIGIINSLVKAVGGILSLIGAILKYPYETRREDKERRSKNKVSTSLSSVLEVFEELTQTFGKLFSLKNLEALFNGFVQMGALALTIFSNPEQVLSLNRAFTVAVADKSVDAAKYLSARVDNIGYGLGFAVGFLIEEVITGIATGGAKTIGTALKLSAESFQQLFKLGKAGIKTIGKAPVSLVDGLIALFKYLRKLNVKKLIDGFIAWFVKLFKTANQLLEEAYKKVFSPSTRSKFKRFGLGPTKYDEVTEAFTFCPIKT
ncbi:hypothetical protein [Winogradskyella sp.]|uniref:hypothetical protein n=1 Tax=Winogradskyella sp. TaxID=1883156 RepID=UPI002633ADC7|nr:hypothetical protein [Winogradskyella sp.]